MVLAFLLLCSAVGVACGDESATCEPARPKGGSWVRVAWHASFNSRQTASWRPYGESARIDVIEADGRWTMRSTFDNSTRVPWCNKGAFVDIDPPARWDDFHYLVCAYKIDKPVESLGFFLHDEAGNWWRCFCNGPRIGEWATSVVTADAFGFGWNDHPDFPSRPAKAPIKQLFVFLGQTKNLNTGEKRTLLLDQIGFYRELPKALQNRVTVQTSSQENASIAIPAPPADRFPLQWKVSNMNPRGNLVVDGHPFFPLVLYSCIGVDAASAAHPDSRYTGPVDENKIRFWFRSIRDAGFNTVQSYTMQFAGGGQGEGRRKAFLKFLDYANDFGLEVMYGAAHPYGAIKLPAKDRERAWEEWKVEVRANVVAWKSHPAMLIWYLMDEPSTVSMPVQNLMDCYRFIKSLDEAHPMLIASCDASDVQYAYGADILAEDAYPIVSTVAIRTMARRLDGLRAIRRGNPPMPQPWAVIQICQWEEGKRLPSANEIRLMSFLSLTRDVKGLLFYEFKDDADRDPQHWAEVGRAIHSIYTALPDLLVPSDIRTDYSVSNPYVESILRWVHPSAAGPAHALLIAVNPTQNIALEPEGLGVVTFTFDKLNPPKGSVAVALDEDADGSFKPGSTRVVPLICKGNRFSLTDTFGPLATHVYRLGLAANR